MTPLPPPSPSTTTTYTHLLSLLRFPTPSPLEIDILPSSHPPEVHYEPLPPSLGIPKALLIPLYLHAHAIFFSRFRSPSPSPPSPNKDSLQPYENSKEEAFNASTILLLHTPTHSTALNYRKAYLLSLKPQATVLSVALQQEIYFLTSLLTSPLVKHTKASTLWAHRLWVVRFVLDGRGKERGSEDGGREQRVEGAVKGEVEGLWDKELEVVMKAGERHPRNYYAWGYARDLLGELAEEGLARGAVGRVHRWCLQHPRDVSGWAFLEFLLREVGDEGEVRRVVWETREYVRKYEWRGESIEWFLRNVRRLQ